MPANAGAIDNSQPVVITLSGDTFTGADGSQLTNNVVVSNLPSGLTVSMVRSNNGTLAVVTLLGNAAPSTANASVYNLGFAFQNGAFTLGSSAVISNATVSNLVVEFFDLPVGTLTYSGTNFNEDANWNDGRIDNSAPVQIVLTGNDVFTGVNGADFVAAGLVATSNVPAGLTALVTRMSSTNVQVTFTGKALAHAAVNSVANLGLAFQNGAFRGGSAAAITNHTVNNLSITFIDPTTNAALNYSGTIFYGASAFNNWGGSSGVITTTNIITLSNGVFSGTNGQVFGGGWLVVSNYPSGLTPVIMRVDDQHLAATLTGTASAYASSNNVTNMAFAFQDGGFSNITAAVVAGAARSDLTVFFAGPVAQNMTAAAVQGTPVSINLNISDPEKYQWQLGATTWSGANGTVTQIGWPFQVQYTPNNGFVGTDTFTFQANDGALYSQIATCTVTVVSNTVPQVFNQSFQVSPNQTSQVFTVSWSDPDYGQVMHFILASSTSSGVLLTNSFGSGGSFQYMPNNNFTGTDSFVWSVTDGVGTSTTATVTLNVGPSQPAGASQVLVLYNANYTGDENTNGVQDSLEVAQYYMTQRGIPTNNILGLNCSRTTYYATNEFAAFNSEILTPVKNKLAALGRTNIAIIVSSYMMPYGVPVYDPYSPVWTTASLDSELAIPYHWNAGNWSVVGGSATHTAFDTANPIAVPNPGFVNDPVHFIPAQNLQSSLGTNMYLVSRLDGAGGVLRIKDLVDEALYAERYAYPTNGAFAGPGGGPASGNIYVNSENRLGVATDYNLSTNSSVITGNWQGYIDVDVNIAWTEHYVGPAGFTLKWLKTNPVIGSTNAGFYADGSSATNAPRAFMYSGWYAYNIYNDVWGWLPGSVASDLDSVSLSANQFRQSGRFVLPFAIQAVAHGASCVAGVLNEPYTIGNPMPNVLVYFMLKGYSWAEASAYANSYLAWMAVSIGDPLYTPFPSGKPLVYDTQVPTIASGYPWVNSLGATGVAVNVMVNSTTNAPMVVNAVVQYGTDTSYTNGTCTLEGFYRQQRIVFPILDGGKTYHYRLILTSPVGISSTNGDYTFVTPTETAFTNNVIPGLVRMQYFDTGPDGVAYHGCYYNSMFYVAAGGAYRPDTGFGWSATTNTLGYYPSLGIASYLFAAPSNTWTRYTVNIAASSLYNLQLTYGNFGQNSSYWARPGGTFHLEQDGANVTGPIVLDPNAGFLSNNISGVYTTPVYVADSWTTATVSNIQLSAGQHILRMVYDTDGASLNYMQFNLVTNPPVANFTASPTNGASPLAVTFTDTSTGTITNWAWSFGDGGATNMFTGGVNYSYTSNGTYTVILTATGPLGSSSSTQANLIVVGGGLPPTISTNPTPVTICAGSSASFTVGATGTGSLTYQWQQSGTNLVNGGHFTGVLTTNLTINSVTTNDAANYLCIVSNTGGSVTSAPASLTVNPTSVGGTASPTAGEVCTGSGTTITLAGNTGSIVKWQSSPDNSIWSDIISTANPYTTGSLTVSAYFRAVVQSGVCGTATSTPALVIVDSAAVGGTATVATNTVCSGNSTTLSAAGVSGSAFQWQSSVDNVTFTNLSGANTLSASTGPLTTNTYFQLVVSSGVCAPATSTVVEVFVNLAPVVTGSPTNFTVCAGLPATFHADASGIPTPSVQWQSSTNGGVSWFNTSNGTNKTLTVGNTPVSRNGRLYQAVFNNACGTVTTTNAILTVIGGQLSVSPATNYFGAVAVGTTNDISFTVTNLGCGLVNGSLSNVTAPFLGGGTNAVPIPGGTGTNATVSFAPVVEGVFTNELIFTGDGGDSTNWVIGTGAIPASASFTAAPTNGLTPLTVTFTDTSTGTITNRFWSFGDSGTTNTVSTNVVYQYTTPGTNTIILTVSGPLGSSVSTQLNWIVVNPVFPPAITQQPASTNLCAGGTVNFAVSATGTPPLSYQWQQGGTNLSDIGHFSGTATTNLTIGPAATGDTGSYQCIVSNAQGSVTSIVVSASVTALATPAVTVSASPGLTNCTGTSVTFTANPVNGGSPSYVWRTNGVVVVGNSSGSLNYTPANGDTVDCQLTSTANCASPTTATAPQLTLVVSANVTPSVSVAASPGLTNCFGTPVTFTASPVNGGSSPSYVWKKNGSTVGTSTNTYTDAGLNYGDTIDCQLTSSFACASPTTANAVTLTLVIGTTPVVTGSPTNFTVCAGGGGRLHERGDLC